VLNRIPTWNQDADEGLFPNTGKPAWLTAVIAERSAKAVPAWIVAVQAERALPPAQLRNKPLPEWTTAERRAFEPAGQVWNHDRQRWTAG
jgi:hypothetical protein